MEDINLSSLKLLTNDFKPLLKYIETERPQNLKIEHLKFIKKKKRS